MPSTLPSSRPNTPLLDILDSPTALRKLSSTQLKLVARELRDYLLFSVGQTGGHFSAGLGVVELTIALHYVLDTPNDQLIWDVGHQSYPHKILTGRREALLSIRQPKGLAAFPHREESPYDAFGVGHSSTSISAALGMAIAKRQQGDTSLSVAVIGDGAMTAGMAFEALNHAAHTRANILVILNDNTMSISKNIGGLARYFERIFEHRHVRKTNLNRLPGNEGVHIPATIFEDLGFHYSGPIDGHDIHQLISQLRRCLKQDGPKLLHINTQKGKGFRPAIDDPIAYHALTKIDHSAAISASSSAQKYQSVFGNWLCTTAASTPSLVAITPAMSEGSGMNEFAQRYPDRFHDVAIAEQHALTFAAGLACENIKPIVAIYSTFLQRAYDQLIHDIALQNLDVTFAIDRAGLVGEDGPTHAGSFDISFLRCIPNMIIACPSDENECFQLLNSAYFYLGPAAVRYPRGKGPGAAIDHNAHAWPIGKANMISQGEKVVIFNFGALLHSTKELASHHQFTLIDMRWVKPLDKKAILKAATSHSHIVCLEENTVMGGAGSAVMELLSENNIVKPNLLLGLPDCFCEHGTREELLDQAGLSSERLEQRILKWLTKIM